MYKIKNLLSPKIHHLYPHLDRRQQIFPIRKVDLNSLEWIGFDMDHTLCRYKKGPIEELSFKLALNNLVNEFNYPKEVLDFEYDSRFSVRGLVIDLKEGLIIKSDSHRRVCQAFLGRKPIDNEKIEEIYHNENIRISSSRFRMMDTLFHLPELSIFASIVQFQIDRGEFTANNTKKIVKDISSAIDLCHKDGSLKKVVLSNLQQFIEYEPELKECLSRLKISGKKLFLLTNSEWYYTKEIMDFILPETGEDSWFDYFDMICVDAQKPKFFRDSSREFKVENPDDAKKPIYFRGGIKTLESHLGTLGEKILYIGDHIYGDIVSTKQSSTWHTLLILPELAEEIDYNISRKYEQDLIGNLDQRIEMLNSERNFFQNALNSLVDKKLAAEAKLRLDFIDTDLNTLKNENFRLKKRLEKSYNPYWGYLLKEGMQISLFADQLRDFASMYTTKVTNLVHYSPSYIFQPPQDILPHDRMI